jgi:hypothetical protein
VTIIVIRSTIPYPKLWESNAFGNSDSGFLRRWTGINTAQNLTFPKGLGPTHTQALNTHEYSEQVRELKMRNDFTFIEEEFCCQTD